ncbi:MAG: hypothetical protein ACK514_07130 [Bacteroidota bacterium]|jgi:hypothetical protein|nr:hypothetical protein [Cytophagales bacterium]MCE2957082.1 hypothetical protein [Flammeovirgaceae bacterium]
MKNFCLLALIATIFCGCWKPLMDQPRTNLNYNELPDTLKYVYRLSLRTGFMDSLQGKLEVGKYPVIILDEEIKMAKYEIEKTGPWINAFIFNIDGHKFRLPFNGNTINDPYVVFGNELYFVVTMNPNISTIEKTEFGKFDLRNELK